MPPRKKIETVELPEDLTQPGGVPLPEEPFERCVPQDGEPCCGSEESLKENAEYLKSKEPLMVTVTAAETRFSEKWRQDAITIDIDDIHCSCIHPQDDIEDATTQQLLDILAPILDELDFRGVDLNDHEEYTKSHGYRKSHWRKDRVTMNQLCDAVRPEEPKKTILARAQAIVEGPRRKSYGHPLPNHQAIANLWNAFIANKAQFYPGAPLTAQDAGIMMVLLKTARLQFEPGHEDSLLDAVGYLACVDIMNREPNGDSE